MAGGKVRKATMICLDLRRPRRLSALTVDARGEPVDWLDTDGSADAPDTVRRAVLELTQRPRRARILLAEPFVRTAIVRQAAEPTAAQRSEALLGEGHPPFSKPSSCHVPCGAEAWLVIAWCDTQLGPLTDELTALGVERIEVVADSALFVGSLPPSSGMLEVVNDHLLVAARAASGEVTVRRLPAHPPVRGATYGVGPPHTSGDQPTDSPDAPQTFPEEILLDGVATLEPSSPWRVLGHQRRALHDRLVEAHRSCTVAELPQRQGERLPETFESAWLLATSTVTPCLHGTALDGLRRRFVGSRRVRRGALICGVIGVLITLTAWSVTWLGRDKRHALRQENAVLRDQLEELRDVVLTVEEIQHLRDTLNNERPPWPPLAQTLVRLSEDLPDGVSYRRLKLSEDAFELEVWLSGPTPEASFAALRRHLAAMGELSNLAWEDQPREPSSGDGVVRILRGQLIPSAPAETPPKMTPEPDEQ